MFFNPKFSYGQAVRLITNIRQDSSLSDEKRGQLLIRRGNIGYIRHAGLYKQEQIIYQVHFLEQNRVIGCRETELIDANATWADNQFEYGDVAVLNVNLQMHGKHIAYVGDSVSVIAVNREDQQDITYRVQVAHYDIDVPARALQAIEQTEVIE